jgi:hypothetical protein
MIYNMSEQLPLGAIILAAGQSRRMIGQKKLLQPLQDKACVRHCVDAALAAAFQPVIVVTGHDAGRIEPVPVFFSPTCRWFGAGTCSSYVHVSIASQAGAPSQPAPMPNTRSSSRRISYSTIRAVLDSRTIEACS